VPDLADYAQIGGAAFAAIAAGAAWRTALLSQRQLEAASSPFVEVQVMANPEDSFLLLSIVNSGSGLARGVNFAIYAMDMVTDGHVGDGFMQPGDKIHVVTRIGPLPVPANFHRGDVGVMVAYRDASGAAHYRTHDGRHRSPKSRIRKRPLYPNRTTVFDELFPKIALSTEVAKRVPSWTCTPEGLAREMARASLASAD